jgi:hypothetical protein
MQTKKHEGQSTEDAEIKKFLEVAEDGKWKRCEKCGNMIERTEGCNHMECRCGYEFCYYCGETWTSSQHGCDGAYSDLDPEVNLMQQLFRNGQGCTFRWNGENEAAQLARHRRPRPTTSAPQGRSQNPAEQRQRPASPSGDRIRSPRPFTRAWWDVVEERQRSQEEAARTRPSPLHPPTQRDSQANTRYLYRRHRTLPPPRVVVGTVM